MPDEKFTQPWGSRGWSLNMARLRLDLYRLVTAFFASEQCDQCRGEEEALGQLAADCARDEPGGKRLRMPTGLMPWGTVVFRPRPSWRDEPACRGRRLRWP